MDDEPVRHCSSSVEKAIVGEGRRHCPAVWRCSIVDPPYADATADYGFAHRIDKTAGHSGGAGQPHGRRRRGRARAAATGSVTGRNPALVIVSDAPRGAMTWNWPWSSDTAAETARAPAPTTAIRARKTAVRGSSATTTCPRTVVSCPLAGRARSTPRTSTTFHNRCTGIGPRVVWAPVPARWLAFQDLQTPSVLSWSASCLCV